METKQGLKISLRAARINAGLKLSEVGKIINKTPQAISNWEQGKTHIKVIDLEKLCELYNVTREDIFLA